MCAPALAALLAGPLALAPAAGAPADRRAARSPSASPRDAEPPRISGPWIGFLAGPAIAFAGVRDLDTDGPFAGASGAVRFGEMVLPWLGVGLSIAGTFATRSERNPMNPAMAARQRLGEGHLLVEFQFVPSKRLPLSLRAGFGVGGGAVRQAGVSGRAGFGGAVFGGSIKYELFPAAKRRRPNRAGGFGIGPELGWFAHTPAAPRRPWAHGLVLAITGTYYFGR
jgi:hypothetical protein